VSWADLSETEQLRREIRALWGRIHRLEFSDLHLADLSDRLVFVERVAVAAERRWRFLRRQEGACLWTY
jgi:hypothetical protein